MVDRLPSAAVANKRDWRVLRTLAVFALGYGLWVAVARTHALNRLIDALSTALSDAPALRRELERLFGRTADTIAGAYGSALFVATFAAPLVFLARTLARARKRAGLADPLDAVRAFVARRPRWTRVLVATPGALWSVFLTLWFLAWSRSVPSGVAWSGVLPGLVLPGAVAFLAHAALARRGLDALLRSTLDSREAAESETQADGFTFDAVAVTPETRAAVIFIAALSAAMTSAALFLPVSTLVRDPRFFALLLAYVAVTAVGALAFRRASRVSIGVDGVLVHGSSRTRFFGYRDVNGARARGNDIELVRGTRVVLRLQLHGKDAARREALVERMRAAIARVDVERHDASAGLVSSSSLQQLTRAAGGAVDYRQATVSREQLWALLEGPSIDTATRRAAAEALATSSDDADRGRLRIAAEQSAEPAVRVYIRELAVLEEDDGDRPPPRKQLSA